MLHRRPCAVRGRAQFLTLTPSVATQENGVVYVEAAALRELRRRVADRSGLSFP